MMRKAKSSRGSLSSIQCMIQIHQKVAAHVELLIYLLMHEAEGVLGVVYIQRRLCSF